MNCAVNPQRRWRNVPSEAGNSDENSLDFEYLIIFELPSSLTGLSGFSVRSEPAL